MDVEIVDEGSEGAVMRLTRAEFRIVVQARPIDEHTRAIWRSMFEAWLDDRPYLGEMEVTDGS